MARLSLFTSTVDWSARRLDALALVALATGLGIRLWASLVTFANPDEAYHALLSTPLDFGDLYASAIRSPHPPLFILLLHYVRGITLSDLGLRMIPLAAGTLFPWVMYRWISRGWNRHAGLGALAILSLAPEMIKAGSEARAYTMALLFMAGGLYFIDRAIQTSSPWRMAGFGLCLYGAILSDYSAAFFAAAVGVYFLLRIREQNVTAGVRILWELSQVGAIVLYAILWVTQVHPMRAIATTRADVEGWLREAYLQAGQNVLFFVIHNTSKQFAFLLPLLVPAVSAMLLFATGLYLLWRRPAPGSMWHSRATAVLLVLPFAATCAAAMIHLFPYGRSRHTIFLGLFIAAGVGIAMDKVARGWIVPLVALGIAATPVWHLVEGQHKWETARVDTRKRYMEEAIAFLKKSVPPGAVLLSESEMRVVLAYYLDAGVRLPEAQGTPSIETVGDWKILCNRWGFGSIEDLRGDLRLLRGHFGLGPDARIWVLDGGFRPLLEPDLMKLHRAGEVTELFRHGRALVAFLTPPGFFWEAPTPADRIPDRPRQSPSQPAIPDYQP